MLRKAGVRKVGVMNWSEEALPVRKTETNRRGRGGGGGGVVTRGSSEQQGLLLWQLPQRGPFNRRRAVDVALPIASQLDGGCTGPEHVASIT